MEFSIATLLSHFSDDKLVAGKILEKKLGCEDQESQTKLQIILDVLEKIGVLVKERGKYRRPQVENLVEAKLRCSSKGFCFAIQDEEEAEDIYVRESYLSNAWNGDRVLVKIIKEGTRRRSPEGEVKLILERANPSLLAKIVKDDEQYLGIPLDDRLLFELQLVANGTNLADVIDHLVHVTVLRYPIGQYPPLGKVTKILGSDAEAAADTDIVCCKHDLPQEFPQAALQQAEQLTANFNLDQELESRADLRNLFTITLEAEDPDQKLWRENAVSLVKNDRGNWQLTIHTIDLAHYIESDSALDQEAYQRGTSIYLADQILPLFPEQVRKTYSFIPGEPRLSMSIRIEFNEEGKIIEFEILPSVVTVDQHLTYPEAQTLLGSQEQSQAQELLNHLFLEVSPLVRAQRLERGGFEISLGEAQLAYKDEGRLGTIIRDSALPVRYFLTELMILAGRVIAKHFIALNVPAIFAVQAPPDWDELEDFLKLTANLGFPSQLNGEEDIKPEDYQHLTQNFAGSTSYKVINYLLLSSLKGVKYSSKPGAHFGLAYGDGYTHCLSPGQRYADLWIQRLLKVVFRDGRDRRNSLAKKGVDLKSSTSHGNINWNVLPPQFQEQLEASLSGLVHQLNEQEKLAEDAEKDLQGLKKAEKMKERTGQVFKGLITGVQSYGFFVEIEELLVEGLVHVSSLKDDWYEYRSRHSCLIGRKNRIAYRLGGYVEVEVKSVDYYRQQIDLVTVSGGVAAPEDLEDE